MVAEDGPQLVERDAEGPERLGLGPVLHVCVLEAEQHPVREREAEEGHDARRHARVGHLRVGDAHGAEGARPPLHDAELADVGAHVRERVHREERHLGEVAQAQPSPVHPLELVLLQRVQLLRREAQVLAQGAPGVAVLLAVGPREHVAGLVPPAEDADRVAGGDLHCGGWAANIYCAAASRRFA